MHTSQLEVVRDRKVRNIDNELERVSQRKESLEEARRKQKALDETVRSQQELIEKKKKEKQEARISGNRELECGIDADLRNMRSGRWNMLTRFCRHSTTVFFS